MTEIVEGEVVDEQASTEIMVRPQEQGLFRTEDPVEFLAKASTTATALAGAVRKQKLYVVISGKDYVRYEGWSMLGSLLGVTAHTVWTRKLEDGWEARVEAHTLNGHIVGAAEAECLRSERLWKDRDDYALRSMAQTRAAAKALRQPLGFVMSLAGFEATPFEEMPPAEEVAAEQKQEKRGRGGLTPAQKKLYAEFKKHEEDGSATQGDLKALVEQAGAEDLAHATPEQCEQVIEWLGVDVPFDKTGPQGPRADGEAPNQAHESGTGASTSEAGAFADEQVVAEFLELARVRGAANLEQATAFIEAQKRTNDGRVNARRLAAVRKQLLQVAPEPVAEKLPL